MISSRSSVAGFDTEFFSQIPHLTAMADQGRLQVIKRSMVNSRSISARLAMTWKKNRPDVSDLNAARLQKGEPSACHHHRDGRCSRVMNMSGSDIRKEVMKILQKAVRRGSFNSACFLFTMNSASFANVLLEPYMMPPNSISVKKSLCLRFSRIRTATRDMFTKVIKSNIVYSSIGGLSDTSRRRVLVYQR
jgi:hypothetical protein